MVLYHIEAEWNTALMEGGQAYVTPQPGDGMAMMQLLFVVNWDTPVKVCYDLHMYYHAVVHLFYPTPGAVASCCNNKYRVGPERQPVLRDLFHCQGNERNLSQCFRAYGSDCGHELDVAVVCS